MFSIAIGQGYEVDLENINRAFWHSPLKLYCNGCLDLSRKLLAMGPHHPCGLIANGSRIMFCHTKRSPITSLPIIVEVVICLLAKAVMGGIAISEKLSRDLCWHICNGDVCSNG